MEKAHEEELRVRQEAIKTIATAYELPKSPKVEDVFSRAFLPPKAERTIQAATN